MASRSFGRARVFAVTCSLALALAALRPAPEHSGGRHSAAQHAGTQEPGTDLAQLQRERHDVLQTMGRYGEQMRKAGRDWSWPTCREIEAQARWSRRLAEAALAVGVADAKAAHVTRMQTMQSSRKDLVAAGRGSPMEELVARYHLLTAQIWRHSDAPAHSK